MSKNENMLNVIPNISADASIKAVFSADDKELVKFINSIMSTSHNPDTVKVEYLKSEFINQKLVAPEDDELNMTYDKIIADLVFRIGNIVYNIEFQTQHDKTMLCRIAEYQFGILCDRLRGEQFNDEYEGVVSLPRMVVVQLEESRDVPDHYKLWFSSETTGEKLLQKFPIIKLWEYSIKELSKSGNHLLLPFKPIEFRKTLKSNGMDEKTTHEFAKYNEKVRQTMLAVARQEKISEKAEEQMFFAHNHIIKYFLDRYIEKDNPARKDVEDMLVVTERPPSITELMIAEAQKKWEAEARQEIAKREAKARQEIAKKEAEARQEIAKKEAEARQEIAEREAETRKARQEIAVRDAEIAKLNAALIELETKAQDQKNGDFAS